MRWICSFAAVRGTAGESIMAVPVLLPTNLTDETYAGVTYHIQGELVPVLHVELSQMPVYFEHHILLWKDPSVQVGLKSLEGAFNRVLAGIGILMTEATRPGRIAFSRHHVRHVLPLHLQSGGSTDTCA